MLVKIAASALVGTALAVGVATCAKAEPADYLTELQAKQNSLFQVRSSYIAFGANMMLDQPNSQSFFFTSCYQVGVGALGQFTIALGNVASLALGSRIAHSPQDRDLIRPMLRDAVNLARTTGTQTAKAIQTTDKLPLCQGGDLSKLAKEAIEAVSSVEDTLAKMAE